MGFGSKKARCQKEGRGLRISGVESRATRIRNRLLGRSNWFKRKPKVDMYIKQARSGKKKKQGP